MFASALGHREAGCCELRVRGGRQRFVGRHARSRERLARQVEPAGACVLVDVAQDVGELERAAEMVGQRFAGFLRQAENAHRKPADGGGHPIAIEVQRRPVRRPNVLFGVHRHAVDDGVEVLLAQIIAARRFIEGGEMGRRVVPRSIAAMSARQRSSSARRSAGGRRPALVGDVVDGAAEVVEREHRLAPALRQDAHGGIEGGTVRHRRRLRAHATAFARARPRRIIAEARKPRGAEPADEREARLAEMDALAQRVAALEIARETPRERVDRRDLRPEPDVPDLQG